VPKPRSAVRPKPIRVRLDDGESVSALLQVPRRARACYVLAHGAGAGMTHPFLAQIADGLAARGIATLRYQFRYMEQGSRRPDSPKIAHAAVRAAVLEAQRRLPRLPLFAGGKSFGGRMTSQAHAAAPLGITGLIFLGFPLHPPDKPSSERAQHLFETTLPLLLLQGTRDKLADLKLLKPLARKLGARATLKLFPEADHSFHVPVRSGLKDSEVCSEILDTIAGWIDDRCTLDRRTSRRSRH
jgi:uncharacterized protein